MKVRGISDASLVVSALQMWANFVEFGQFGSRISDQSRQSLNAQQEQLVQRLRDLARTQVVSNGGS